MMKPRIVTVQGLQFGSEAKGSIASCIAHGWEPDTVASAWHPNAGHTCYLVDPIAPSAPPRKYVHSMLPIGALAPSVRTILIGPGAVVNYKRLLDEIQYALHLLQNKHIIIHPQASIWDPADAEAEASLVRIGSTMKGSMIAQVRKMYRLGKIIARDHDAPDWTIRLDISSILYNEAIDASERLLVEGSQGFGLGIHTDFYPYCTSRDVSTAQLLADCRIPFQDVTTVGVCRTFPIRVANRYDAAGKQIGTSGPGYVGQQELDWQRDLNRQPELTTVTKLPRRIFEFSHEQVKEAARIMRPDVIALTFCDYLTGEPIASDMVDGERRAALRPQPALLASIIEKETGAPVRLFSYGPYPDEIWQHVSRYSPWPLAEPFSHKEPWDG